ncbi:MAG: ribosome maturation factor RimP [Ruminococcus sp.]|nr:ribosome maturation factor RimP [Ruminococcus sp.]
MNTVEKVRQLAQPLCDEQELFLWDVRFEKEGASWYLKILIDRDGGVDMDAVEKFTRPMNELLDEADPIQQSYILEVGSPGLGRELRREEHFIVCIGDEVRVKTIRPVNGEREFIGILYSFEKNEFVIAQSEAEEDRLTFKLSDCAYVKLNDDQF